MDNQTQPKKITLAEALKQNYIKPGSEAHQQLIEAGYQMTLADAEMIVKEWEKDHKSWPLDEVKKAKAMLAAAQSIPQVIDTDPGWHREHA